MRKPRRSLLVAGALTALFLARSAFPESIHDQLSRAAQCLSEGKFQEAIDLYRQVQVDAPELESVRYALGCACFNRAESLLITDPTQASAAYQEASAPFQGLSGASDAALRREAQLGALNCAARLAEIEARPQEYIDAADKSTVPVDEFKARVAKLRQVSQGYEQFLRQYPDNAAARRNLERLRYFWKRMLQEPPAPPPPVRIMSTSTEYPDAQARPLPEEASVVLVPNTQQGGAS